ncbi:hypothetical protein [Halococcus sediminicola]|uniref:hypothetical protein n=1 Tax=Halococcus sediminicola TaxID=1264579 RepID=UPI0012AB4656|nr:hypothetical protein [Halococcus sediminicola]
MSALVSLDGEHDDTMRSPATDVCPRRSLPLSMTDTTERRAVGMDGSRRGRGAD